MTLKLKRQSFAENNTEESLMAYCIGAETVIRYFIDWAERNDVKIGCVFKDDIQGLYTKMMLEYEELKGMTK